MASDVGSSVAGEARRGQSRSSDASRTSSKTSSKKGMQTTENAIPNFQSRRGSERPEKLNRQDYVNMRGGDIFEAFMRKREAVLQEAANYQKMKMMTRHSARYIDAHERSLTNEFQKFLEFAETQRLNEARRAKLLGLPPQSAPANVFAARPAGNFGLRPLERLTREEWEERRASAKRYLKIQMERIQNIRVARTSIRPRLRSAPSLQAVDLSDVIRKKTMTPRRLTQFSAEFQREELPHYAMFPVQRRPATVPAEAQENLYRWMEDFFREHVPVEDADSESSKRGKRCSLKDSQLRDEQM